MGRVKRGICGKMLLLCFVSLFSFVFIALFSEEILSSINVGKIVKADSIESDLNVEIHEVLAIGLINCDGTNNSVVSVNVTPNSTGVFKSNCQTVEVDTNAPGYTLTAKAEGFNPNYDSGNITNNLLYLNPINVSNFTNGFPIISTTANTIANPSVLNNDTWGFAVEGLNSTDTVSNEASNPIPSFDTTYTVDNQNNKFAELPTADTTIYKTSVFPLPEVEHTFYYGTRLTTNTVAGTYATTVTYTAVGEVVVPPPTTCNNSGKAPECIEFTVDVGTAGTYSIPISGRVANMDHTYDWDVYVDGYLTSDCTNGNCIGTSSIISSGISLTSLTNGQHQILIVPNDEASPGWGNAFGHYNNTDGANIQTNKDKLISLDALLTTMAFAPKTTESTTDASNMFAYMFYGCSSLTTTMQTLNTYTLPNTITNLSYFLNSTHRDNTSLVNPIDLSPVVNWINNNNSITTISGFLYFTHFGNTSLTNPIDLSPITNWFNSNSSIINMNSFLLATHRGNSNLTKPTNLYPLKNWFNANNTIDSIFSFLSYTHYGNSNLTDPIDLSPLANWFSSNIYITNIFDFLAYTHTYNTRLTSAIDLTPLSGWFRDNRSMLTLYGFMTQTHSYNPNLRLTGQTILPNWVKTMTTTVNENIVPIWDTELDNANYSFYRTFYTTSAQSGDTGEVKFQDDTVLSSVGKPTVNRETFTNRVSINPENDNWK